MKDKLEFKAMTAVRFIEDNLHNPITREDIAAQSCLSLRQLSRLFQRCTGDTLAHYVKVRRLTEASKELVLSSETMLSTALKYQFHSPEVFTRAFRKAFWLNPSQFRRINCAYTAKQRNFFSDRQLGTIQQSNYDCPDLITVPARHFVGLVSVQPHYGFQVEQNIEEGISLTDRLWDYLPNIHGAMDQWVWNIAFIRQTMNDFHEIENFFAVEVTAEVNPPSELTCLCLPCSQYARFIHAGSDSDIALALSLAFQWLEKSPYFLGDAPSLCRIDPHQKYPTEIYLPINRLFSPQLRWWQGYHNDYLLAIAGH